MVAAFFEYEGIQAGAGQLALHLLQSSLMHVNTLLVQQVLANPKWADKLTAADRRGLSPLFWTHVNRYLAGSSST